MSQYTHLSEPDPELTAVFAQLPPTAPPLDIVTLREVENAFVHSQNKASFSEAQLKIEDWKVRVEGGEIPVRSYVAQTGVSELNPLLVWAHGGGFVRGGLHSDELSLQQLAVDLKLSVVNVDYRLAPEHKFPTGLNDTYEALKWAAAHTRELHADVKKGFLLGGCSAGAQFTAVLTHRARDDPTLHEKLTGQILQIPTVVHKDAFPDKYKGELLSMQQNKSAPFLNASLMDLFLKNYTIKDPADPQMSPLLFPSHKDLPPVYLQVCGLDPLRDEGFLYEKVLKEAGVQTKLDIYPGMPHGFHDTFPQLGQAVKWDKDLREGIRWMLSGSA